MDGPTSSSHQEATGLSGDPKEELGAWSLGVAQGSASLLFHPSLTTSPCSVSIAATASSVVLKLTNAYILPGKVTTSSTTPNLESGMA